MRRREFLRATAALAAGGSIAPPQIASVEAAEPQQSSPSPTAPGQSPSEKFGNALQPKLRKASRFFEDPDINYVFQTMLGRCLLSDRGYRCLSRHRRPNCRR